MCFAGSAGVASALSAQREPFFLEKTARAAHAVRTSRPRSRQYVESDADIDLKLKMITIESHHLAEMRRHGERDYPFECCGLMLGQFEGTGHKSVSETYAISNAREEEAKRNRFLIRPEELMRGEKYAREKGLDVVGFYHSHPDEPAVPSKYDLEHAWPTYSYVVVSVEKGQAVDLRSWEMEPDRSRFDEEEIAGS